MKTLIITALFLLCIFHLFGQSIYSEYGFNRARSFLEEPMQYSYNNFEDQYKSWSIGFEQCVLKAPKVLISFDYTKNDESPFIIWRNPETTYGGFGIGTADYTTYAFGIKYKKSFFKDRFSLSPGIFFKIVDVVRTWPDSSMTYWDPVVYYPYSGISYCIAYPGTYLVPEIRLAFGVRFLWRMYLYLNMAYARGFSKTQDLVWEYSYKGVPQPKAVAYVNGTELRFHLGLKFDIVRCKKKEFEMKTDTYQKKKRKYK